MPLFITNNSVFKSAVIQKSSRTKKVAELGFLGFVRKQSVFKRLSHFDFSKYSSIALRTSSATLKPDFLDDSFNNLNWFSVRYIFVRFIHLIYTIKTLCQSKKHERMRIPTPAKAGSPLRMIKDG